MTRKIRSEDVKNLPTGEEVLEMIENLFSLQKESK